MTNCTSRMRLIERFTQAKSGMAADNEDAIVFTRRYAAIIDGATRHGGKRIAGDAPGRTIARAIAGFLEHLEVDRSGGELVQAISDHVRRDVWPLWDAADAANLFNAAVIIYTAGHRTVTSLGDCSCRIGRTVHTETKAVDRVLSETRSLCNALTRLAASPNGEDPESAAVDGKIAPDPGREMILPLLELQPLLANNAAFPEFGYGVINGNPVPEQFVRVWQVTPGSEIVLASDGYLTPAPSLEEAELQLRSRLKEDPGMDTIRPFATKGAEGSGTARSFDDRSYVRFVTA